MRDNTPNIQANRLHAALANEYDDTEAGDVKNLAIYALVDLKHLCDLHGLDFGKLNRNSQALYVAELQ